MSIQTSGLNSYTNSINIRNSVICLKLRSLDQLSPNQKFGLTFETENTSRPCGLGSDVHCDTCRDILNIDDEKTNFIRMMLEKDNIRGYMAHPILIACNRLTMCDLHILSSIPSLCYMYPTGGTGRTSFPYSTPNGIIRHKMTNYIKRLVYMKKMRDTISVRMRIDMASILTRILSHIPDDVIKHIVGWII